jgi:Rha family phage regulatory protein
MVKTPARRTAPHIAVVDGQPTTTSRDIAETFGKRHDNLLRAIATLDCSPEFSALNFEAVGYTDGKGEKRTEYRITRDGFAFLCMGFTGAKAAQWKERYINTFNKLAERLADHSAGVSKKVQATKPLALPAPARRMTPDMEAAINARAFEIVSSALPGVHQWLLDQVLRGCVNPDGTAAPNFANTLASADFAAYSTNYASKHLQHATQLLGLIHQETGELITRVQAERQRIANQKDQS